MTIYGIISARVATHTIKDISTIRNTGRSCRTCIKYFDHYKYAISARASPLTLEGKNINLEMIRAGLAEVYRGKPPKGFDSKPYIQAEAEAKETKREMWRQGDKYISPKEWRKMHKGK